MRTIKFRIWDREKGTFLPYACWLNHLDTNDFTCFDRWFKMDEENCTLQQFTGLKDKNGKDIYEGDFLQFSCDYTFPCGDPDIVEWKNQEVFYDEEKACFFFGRKHEFQILDKIMPKTLEVTGNIFENPEKIGTDE
jgi:uncharacterized phage protein (TIGR01671 family)